MRFGPPTCRILLTAAAIAGTALAGARAQGQEPAACEGGALVGFVFRSGQQVPARDLAVAPGTTLAFEVQGGACPVSLHLSTNASGATFDPASGIYVAGRNVGSDAVDVIVAVDAAGQVASWRVRVSTLALSSTEHAVADGGSTHVQTAWGCGGSTGGVTWFAAFTLLQLRRRRPAPRPTRKSARLERSGLPTTRGLAEGRERQFC